MDDLLSEKEQIDQMRSWWSEYGAYVIGGIAVGAIAIFGLKYYQSNKLQSQIVASAHYESLIEHVVDGNLDEAIAVTDTLLTDFSNTSYVGPAGLAMAKLYMDKNRDQDAADTLQEVVMSDADDELRHVARLRLARVLLYQGKSDEVVELLDGEEESSFSAAYGEIIGDAYAAMGRVEDAQMQYQEVLLNADAGSSVDRQLVQWKALDLPEVEMQDAPADEVEPEVDDEVESLESVTEEVE